MSDRQDVTVLIPNWNGRPWLPGCLDALAAQTYQSYSILMIDNGSTDDSVLFVKQYYPHVEILPLPENGGFTGALNAGLKQVKTPLVILLNTDTRVAKDWLPRLVSSMEHAPAHVVGVSSLMLQMDQPNLIDDAGDQLSWFGSATKTGRGRSVRNYNFQRQVFSVCAGAGIYKSSFLEETRGLYQPFFAYLEDVDLGMQATMMGYQMWLEPSASVLHKSHGSQVPDRTYVRWITRNRLMLFLLNVPGICLLQHIWRIAFGQMYFFIAYGRPIASLRGYADLIRLLPGILKERRRRKQLRRISPEDLATRLSKEWPQPPLRHFLWGYVKAVLRRLGIGSSSI